MKVTEISYGLKEKTVVRVGVVVEITIMPL